MSKRISVLVALDGADDGLKRAITSAEKSLGELSASAKTAGDKAAAGTGPNGNVYGYGDEFGGLQDFGNWRNFMPEVVADLYL
jgi:hypothetical protein